MGRDMGKLIECVCCGLILNFQVENLKGHHGWLLNTLAFFKAPNATSKAALSTSRVDIGSHSMEIKPELRDIALQVSAHLVCSCFFSRNS